MDDEETCLAWPVGCGKLSANGPIANSSQFQSDLAAEQAKVQDDVNNFKTYPVIALGFIYRF